MPLKTHLDDEPTLNLTAMLDVMFLLIIFFMLGTRFIDDERKIGLRVPEVVDRGTLTAAPARKEVNVFRDGTITLDKTPVTLDELTTRLAAARRQYSDLGVLVRGDARGEFQNVAAVLTACKQAGIQDLGITVRSVTLKQQAMQPLLRLDRLLEFLTEHRTGDRDALAGLAIFTVGLAVLLYTRWGQYKPLRKCMAMSLLAHLLLAGYAATVQIVTPIPPPPEQVIHVSLGDGPAEPAAPAAARRRCVGKRGTAVGGVPQRRRRAAERSGSWSAARPISRPSRNAWSAPRMRSCPAIRPWITWPWPRRNRSAEAAGRSGTAIGAGRIARGHRGPAGPTPRGRAAGHAGADRSLPNAWPANRRPSRREHRPTMFPRRCSSRSCRCRK